MRAYAPLLLGAEDRAMWTFPQELEQLINKHNAATTCNS